MVARLSMDDASRTAKPAGFITETTQERTFVLFGTIIIIE